MNTNLHVRFILFSIFFYGIILNISCNENNQTPVPIVVNGITFKKFYGDTYHDTGESIIQTSDGGYVFAGTTGSRGSVLVSGWIVKTDSLGNILWNRRFGSIGISYLYSVQETKDKGFILCGYKRLSFNYPDTPDGWLLKLDSTGIMMWEKKFGGSLNDELYGVRQTSDDGYVIGGVTLSFDTTGYKLWLLKTNAVGEEIWNKTYFVSGAYGIRSLHVSNDGGFICAARKDVYDSTRSNGYIMKIDENGKLLWSQMYGGTNTEVILSIDLTSDEGIIAAGASYPKTGNMHVWLFKTNESGDQLWMKLFGGGEFDNATNVQALIDGGFIVAAYHSGEYNSWEDPWLIRLDANGNILWDKTFVFSSRDLARCVQQTKDGGFILLVNSNSTNNGYFDVCLIKTDKNGNIAQ